MKALFEPLYNLSEFEKTLEAFSYKKTPVSVSGCADTQKWHFVAALMSKVGGKRLILTRDALKAQAIVKELSVYGINALHYPEKDLLFFYADVHNNRLIKDRMRVIKALLTEKDVTVVASIGALQDRILPIGRIRENILHYDMNGEVDLDVLVKKLVAAGYTRQEMVMNSGEFSVRGDIVDIFPLTEDDPVRMELFGDTIDALKMFNISTQRSVETLDHVDIFPAAEFFFTEDERLGGIAAIRDELNKVTKRFKDESKFEECKKLTEVTERALEDMLFCPEIAAIDSYVGYFTKDTSTFLDYFDEDTFVIVDEPEAAFEGARIAEEVNFESMTNRIEKGMMLPSQAGAVIDYKKVIVGLHDRKLLYVSSIQSRFKAYPAQTELSLTVRTMNSYGNRINELVEDLEYFRKQRYTTIIVSSVKSKALKLEKELNDLNVPAFYSDDKDRVAGKGEIMVLSGGLTHGFEYPMIGFIVLTEDDIFLVKKKIGSVRARKAEKVGMEIKDFDDLTYGDYVVHENHGIGVFKGIDKIEIDGVIKDYMKIEYADKGNLYIPATGLAVVRKFASADCEKKPKLNKLNSVEWRATKERVRIATSEVAKELVNLYAIRDNKKGFACSEDSIWQTEFEDSFPYNETGDQLKAIEDTKRDMESNRIMDRLICGDVGYGKTEIAIRAAFKAVMNNKQVAVLAPTTILVQQHFNTFSQRMKDYPVKIGMLSRFKTAGQNRQTIEALKEGRIDIVIGTHRLLSKDVGFKDLGLLVIDEEQRFGVTHKEQIKQMKKNVDVLTLSATPIPRTLHMSMIGIRDMSVLDEPPMDRLPVQTFVMEHDDEVVREAITRELTRHGQVYYVNNRIEGIEDLATHISQLVPEATVAFAHGKMNKNEVEKIMYAFVNGEIDVLVSTTIVETGLDIPNVNTIIIDNADRMGLSQLYQLRGRVGRSNRVAYAFLLYRKNKVISEVAEKRLRVIKEFTELGSGIKIAGKDLEIRGAGNILGTMQTGHLEAVGYDLYCKLLSMAIQEISTGEIVDDNFDTIIDLEFDAYIPEGYIKNENMKLEMYQKIASVVTESEQTDLIDELCDRYGAPPKPVLNLIDAARIRAQLRKLYVTSLKQTGNVIVMTFYDHAKIKVEKVGDFVAERMPKLRITPGKVTTFRYQLEEVSKGKKSDGTIAQIRAFLDECIEELV